jgi:UPF0271 protein
MGPVPSIDLNADVGEGAENDDAVLDQVTSASVACGVHAGDLDTMRRTVEAAVRRGVVVGAHPSYPDRDGFGRRPMDLTGEEVAEVVLSQVATIEAVARACGTSIRFVKPHGALYLRMADDAACARAVAEAVRDAGDLVLLAQAGTGAVDVAERAGVVVATEAFADRAYRRDGRLVPRDVDGGVITDVDEVVRRAAAIALDHQVTTIDGTTVSLTASSICVHGDTPGASEMARSIRSALEGEGVRLRPFVL